MVISPQPDLESLSTKIGISIAKKLTGYPFVINAVARIPYSFAKQRCVLPLEENEGKVLVAMADPCDCETIEDLQVFLEAQIQEVLCPREVIEDAIQRVYHPQQGAASDVIAEFTKEGDSKTQTKSESEDIIEQKSDSPIVRILNAVMLEAIQQGASDIHFEPFETGLEVRYRIDGVLQKRHAPPKEYHLQLITRLKVMAQLDIAEHRLPQDGRIKLQVGKREIDFRMSTVPVVYGERIVLRILDKGNVVLGLDRIGMSDKILSDFRQLIQLNEGIVLVTGPTGSGKTTTLYSAVSEISSSESNIMTIEDPVEYKLSQIAQIGVNPKISLDFATGLRHILRQDPDVIMIGEIRDRETAEIAIQASLTGHLVLSTLHTNDAPSALTRLVEMGIEPYLLSSSVVGVLAQRLLRTNCLVCKTEYIPKEEELRDLGITYTDKEIRFCKSQGCPQCFGSGYKGRIGIYELMVMASPIKRQLLKSADALELQRVAIECGMSTLRSEGAKLVIQGHTSSAEVLRVTRRSEEIG